MADHESPAHARTGALAWLAVLVVGCPAVGPHEVDARADADRDGYDALSWGGTDCDDQDAGVHPGAEDIWYDGVDSDCDGADDLDRDGDGFASAAHGGTDCDDDDPAVHPDAAEIWYDGRDQDCSGGSDADQDGDGHPTPGFGGGDCDDTNPEIHPGAVETYYDGVDANCDGRSDDDADQDGFDDWQHGGADCDDSDPFASPAADERCDGRDTDCDGAVDEDSAVDVVQWFADGDGDGWGAGGPGVWACSSPSAATRSGDCDDADPARHPGATETYYDGVDANCDGASDGDADGDGHDWDGVGGDDCDDGDPLVHPGAAERAFDGAVDDDCDGVGYVEVDLVAARARISGLGGRSFFGAAVAVGDPIGDGGDHLVAGAPYELDQTGGAVFVFGGPPLGAMNTGDATGSITHGGIANLGTALALADVDGDGIDDVLAGSDVEAAEAGALYIHRSPIVGATTTASAMAVLHGAPDANLGSATSALGDLDGDGYEDFAVGAFDEDTFVFEGGVSWLVDGPLTGHADVSTVGIPLIGQSLDGVGFGTQALGDVDGDGLTDLVVGAFAQNSFAGGAYVVLGVPTMALSMADADVSIAGESPSDSFGVVALGPGDLDGDGRDDLVVGSTSGSFAGLTGLGAAYVFVDLRPGAFSASVAAARLHATEDTDVLQSKALDRVGDLDGDGVPEILFGGRRAAGRRGAVWLFGGHVRGTSFLDDVAEVRFVGEEAGAYIGRSIAVADLDADGRPDLAAGSMNAMLETGAVYFWSGLDL